jgi:hypothetical protein
MRSFFYLKVRILTFLFFFLFLGFNSVFAQDGEKFFIESKLLQKVKLFEEFVDRFNFDKMPNQKEIPDSILTAPNFKEQYLLSLFNREDKRLKETAYQSTIISFVSQILSKKQKIIHYAPNIISEVDVLVNYRGKEQTIKLFFEVETVANGGKKWTLSRVKAPFIPQSAKSDAKSSLPPNSDGNDFIGITKWFTKDKNVVQLYDKEFKYDPLSVFYAAIQQGDLILLNSKETSYHILQVEGWAIEVSSFNRETYNSGWLISNLKENKLNKESYLDSISK